MFDVLPDIMCAGAAIRAEHLSVVAIFSALLRGVAEPAATEANDIRAVDCSFVAKGNE